MRVRSGPAQGMQLLRNSSQKPPAKLPYDSPRPSIRCSSSEGGANSVEQDLIIKGFHKKLDRAFPHCLYPHSRISMCGDENDRSFTSVRLKLRLQFQP